MRGWWMTDGVMLAYYCIYQNLPEQLCHRPTIMNPADRAREQLGHREHRHVGQALLVCQGDRIGNHDFFDGGGFEAFDGGAGEYAVRGATEDIARALLIHYTHGLGERAGGIDLVIDDEGVFALHGADDAHSLGDAIVAVTALLYDSKRGVQAVGQLARFLGEAFVGGDYGEIVHCFFDKVTRLED